MNTFVTLRLADLKASQAIFLKSWHKRSLPASNELTLGRIFTPLALIAALNVTLAMTTRNGRRRCFEVIEAILASILIAALLVAVLGMPIGAIYLVLKATAYFIRALLGLPFISAILTPIRDSLVG